MRVVFLLTSLILVGLFVRAQEVRTWTDIKGSRVEAEFAKLEGTSVYLKLKDGKVVPTKLQNLSEEDRVYVRALTYKPREVTVTFRQNGYESVGEEVGTSPAATLRDIVVVQLSVAREGQKSEAAGDSRWKIESVDVLGSRITARKPGGAEDLVSEGQFVFVSFTVENDSKFPAVIPPPLLVDKRDRRFLQVSRADFAEYIPEGTVVAGAETVQPGFKRLFCAVYEIPPAAEPAAVEIFPTKTSTFAIQRFAVKGKLVQLGDTAGPAAKPAEEATGTAAKKASVFMKCARVGQGGDTSGYWYYDRNKKRSLTYGAELRGMDNSQQTVKVKAFFIGAVSGNRDVVVCQKEEEIALEPGKIARVTLQSDEVVESTYYNYSGSRISGAKLKGVIIQAWCGDEVVSNFVSLNQWKRYAEMNDVAKQMGELTRD